MGNLELSAEHSAAAAKTSFSCSFAFSVFKRLDIGSLDCECLMISVVWAFDFACESLICKIRPTLSLKQQAQDKWKSHLLSSYHKHFSTTSYRNEVKGGFAVSVLRAAGYETQRYAEAEVSTTATFASCCVRIACSWCTAVQAAIFAPFYFTLHQSVGEFEHLPI